MKTIKRLLGAGLLVMLGASLSGCIVVPFGHGPYYRGHYAHYDYYDHSYGRR